MIQPEPLPVSIEEYDAAFTEVSFLLDIFSAAVHDLMGGATAPVGRVSGRRAARRLPIQLPEPTLEKVLDALAAGMQEGFEMSHRPSGRTTELCFGSCVIRDVCANRNTPVGGPLCILFHQHLDGMVNELLARPAKSTLTETGESCLVSLEVR